MNDPGAPLILALGYSLLPVAGMTAGGAAAAWWQPRGKIRSYIQHFAAGIVFAAVGVEILPDVIHQTHPLAAGVGFGLGVAVMLGIRALSRHAESRVRDGKQGDLPWAMVVAVAVDEVVDGLLIGFGFAVGERQGLLLAIALTGCAVSLGLATATTLVDVGTPPQRAAGLTWAIGCLPVPGAAAGILLAARLTPVLMGGVLAFTCAALLYLVTEELLVEAHRAQQGLETALTTAIFFGGFLLLLLLEMQLQPLPG